MTAVVIGAAHGQYSAEEMAVLCPNGMPPLTICAADSRFSAGNLPKNIPNRAPSFLAMLATTAAVHGKNSAYLLKIAGDEADAARGIGIYAGGASFASECFGHSNGSTGFLAEPFDL